MTLRARSAFGIAGALVVALAALASCRAIVGIEELTLVDTPDAYAVKIAKCVAGDCRRCCKMEFAEFQQMEQKAESRDCLCVDLRCNSRCSDGGDYCATGGPPSADCARCLDDTWSQSQCIAACRSEACRAGLACLDACE